MLGEEPPLPETASVAAIDSRQRHLNITNAMITSQLDPLVWDWLGDDILDPQVIWCLLAERYDLKNFNKTLEGYTKYFQLTFLEMETVHDFLACLMKL